MTTPLTNPGTEQVGAAVVVYRSGPSRIRVPIEVFRIGAVYHARESQQVVVPFDLRLAGRPVGRSTFSSADAVYSFVSKALLANPDLSVEHVAAPRTPKGGAR